MTELAAILAERRKQHGDFRDHAAYTQSLKAVLRDAEQEKRFPLSCVQREALEMIVHKIGRILAGDPNHIDTWDDIAGYATLVANELREKSTAPAGGQ